MSYALVIGTRATSKSTLASQVVSALSARGWRVAGFTQRTCEEGPGRKTVEVVRIRDQSAVRIGRTAPAPGDAAAVCAFGFEVDGFVEARRWVEADAAGADVLVLDGLGKLELGGGGHRGAIDHALRSGALVVLAVREENLVYALEALGLEEPVASYGASADAAELDRFVDAVGRAVTAAAQRAAEAGRGSAR